MALVIDPAHSPRYFIISYLFTLLIWCEYQRVIILAVNIILRLQYSSTLRLKRETVVYIRATWHEGSSVELLCQPYKKALFLATLVFISSRACDYVFVISPEAVSKVKLTLNALLQLQTLRSSSNNKYSVIYSSICFQTNKSKWIYYISLFI